MSSTDMLMAPTKFEWFWIVGAILFLVLYVSILRWFGQRKAIYRSSSLGNIGISIELFVVFLLSAKGLSRNALEIFSFASLLIFFLMDRMRFFKSSHFPPNFFNNSLHLFFSFSISVLFFYHQNRFFVVFATIWVFLLHLFRIFIEKEQSSGADVFVPVKNKRSILALSAITISTFGLILLFYYLKFVQFLLPVISAICIFFILMVVLYFLLQNSAFYYLIFVAALLLSIFFRMNTDQLWQFFEGFLFAIGIVFLSYKARFLSFSGSLMTFLLAVFIFGLGGWPWAVPILTFFILSSLLSKFGKKQKSRFKNTFEKSGVRDYAQVLANGGIPGVLVIVHFFWPFSYLYLLYLLSLAVAAADTWSTELGVLSPSMPRLITNLKKVEPGISGAVSFLGTFGGLVGASLVILSGFLFIDFSFFNFFLLLILSMLGDLADSLIGATLQGQYQCQVCGKYTEKKIHCSEPTKLIQGFEPVNNDTVNLSANIFSLFLFLLIIFVFQI